MSRYSARLCTVKPALCVSKDIASQWVCLLTCVSGGCSVLKCVYVCLCVYLYMCVVAGDLMGFPTQQKASARLTPPTCSGVCTDQHTVFLLIPTPAAESFIRWLGTPRCVFLLANAQQRIRGADNHHWRHTGGE